MDGPLSPLSSSIASNFTHGCCGLFCFWECFNLLRLGWPRSQDRGLSENIPNNDFHFSQFWYETRKIECFLSNIRMWNFKLANLGQNSEVIQLVSSAISRTFVIKLFRLKKLNEGSFGRLFRAKFYWFVNIYILLKLNWRFVTIGFSVNCSPFATEKNFIKALQTLMAEKSLNKGLYHQKVVYFSFSFIILYYEIHPGNARIRKGNGNEYLCPNEAW